MIKDLIEYKYAGTSEGPSGYTSLRSPREMSITKPQEPRVPSRQGQRTFSVPREIKRYYDKLKLMLHHIKFPGSFKQEE